MKRKEPSISTIYDEEYSNVGVNLSSRLSQRFKTPFYVSFNLDDELLNVNQELYFTIERNIIDKLLEIKAVQ